MVGDERHGPFRRDAANWRLPRALDAFSYGGDLFDRQVGVLPCVLPYGQPTPPFPMTHVTPSIATRLRQDLKLPVIVAPMFLVSTPKLVLESCKAGLIGSLPTQNARTTAQLREWFNEIRDELAAFRAAGHTPGGWAASVLVHNSYDRFPEELEMLQEYRPDIVVTALGSPKRVLNEVHGYGGAVFADVMSLEHARKAADAGADGLVLVCHGAGGHTGANSPFAFVVRSAPLLQGHHRRRWCDLRRPWRARRRDARCRSGLHGHPLHRLPGNHDQRGLPPDDDRRPAWTAWSPPSR